MVLLLLKLEHAGLGGMGNIGFFQRLGDANLREGSSHCNLND